MAFSRSFSLLTLLLSAAPLVAQNAPGGAAPLGTAPLETQPTTADAGLVRVENADVARLPSLLSAARGISLGADLRTLEANRSARDALLDYVAGGGVVFVHTDAARLFGFQTVEARQGNPRQGGQIYGRARAALPWAAHPLLWGDAERNRSSAVPTRLPGVNTVFYQARVGDHFVVSHPAGTPILRVSDLTAFGGRELFASALAPFGAGLVVFTPDFVDPRRGDGAQFVRNLLALLPGADGARAVALPQSAVLSGAPATIAALERALQNAGGNSNPLPAFGTTAATPTQPDLRNPRPANVENGVQNNDIQNTAAANAANGATPTEATNAATAPVANASPVLILSRAEAIGALAGLRTERRDAILNVLRARVALLRGNAAEVAATIEALADNRSREAELIRASANTAALFSPGVVEPNARLAFANAAIQALGAAAGSPSLLVTREASGPFDLSAASLQAWTEAFVRRARILAVEPPLVREVGSGANAVVVRFFPGDTGAAGVAQTAGRLVSSRAFGWYPDELEVLLFPTAQTLAAYRAATGVGPRPNVPAPLTVFGDVVNGRILLASIDTDESIVTTNGRITELSATGQTIEGLSRLYAYALLDSYFDGDAALGARVPGWMTLGFEEIVAATTVAANALNAINDNQNLEQFVQAGGLLTPQQFRGAAFGSPIARAQARSIVAFFYQTYGVGAWVETVQRLAAGQTIDEALEATIGETEASLFVAWRNARFGPRNFPNQPAP